MPNIKNKKQLIQKISMLLILLLLVVSYVSADEQEMLKISKYMIEEYEVVDLHTTEAFVAERKDAIKTREYGEVIEDDIVKVHNYDNDYSLIWYENAIGYELFSSPKFVMPYEGFNGYPNYTEVRLIQFATQLNIMLMEKK